MRILWILPYSPLPATSGGKTRQFQLLRALARRGHRITVLAQAKTLPSTMERARLESFLERLVLVRRRSLKNPKTLLAALLSPCPILASINGFAPELGKRFEQLLEQHWDIIQIEHSYAFQPFEAALQKSGRPFILSEHNVESALGEASSQQLPLLLRPIAPFDRWRYRRWEKRVLPQATRIVAVSNEDAQQLSVISGRPVSVVVNGVDTTTFAANRPNPASKRMLFVGNYDYAPNTDAVQWAVETIMPEIWRQNPYIRLCVCGHAMPPQWAERWPDWRLEWQGFVPDLGRVQRKSLLFLAPLRHGGGSKLKTIEAMAAGLPVVSTAQGVSGLAVTRGREYVGGETAEELAAAAVALFNTPEQAIAMGEAGRRYVQKNHDWEIAARQLETVYLEMRTEKERQECA